MLYSYKPTQDWRKPLKKYKFLRRHQGYDKDQLTCVIDIVTDQDDSFHNIISPW